MSSLIPKRWESNRHEVTFAALAHSYSVGESFDSGEARLMADGSEVEKLEAELICQSVAVHYNPKGPSRSMFVDDTGEGLVSAQGRAPPGTPSFRSPGGP
jgi:hypothetical protein